MIGFSRKAATLALMILPVSTVAQIRDAGPVSIATLARDVAIPYDMFTLPNGLRVVVHTDRSAKTVNVQVDYPVGSTAAPAGKTGFAYLF